MNIELAESELKIILEALIKMESAMSEVCATSDDPDEIAEVGNDLIGVRLLLKPLKEKAIQKYGENVINFSRELL
ncbi:MAG: hypothetical protein ACRBCS_11925 [Cellvibrionaceae bacterium]